MTLVVVVKCVDGLVLAADTKQTLPKLSDNRHTPIDSVTRETEKLFHLKEPQNYVGVLHFGYGAVNAGFKLPDGYEKIARYSIGACINRFEREIQDTNERRFSVAEFQEKLENYLVVYWERYRKQRVSDADMLKRQTKQRKLSNRLEVLSGIEWFSMTLLVAGYDEGEKTEAHVVPIFLRDDNECWQASKYVYRSPNIELIPTTCGIYYAGDGRFVEPVLTEGDPVQHFDKLQHGCEEATIAEIADIKARNGVKFVNRQPGFFSSDKLTTHDGQRLAQLLIKGTADFFCGEGFVGGPIHICTINPLIGIKCDFCQ